VSDEDITPPENAPPLQPQPVEALPPLDAPQPDNRILEPDDCRREPFLGVNREIAALIDTEKERAGEQLSFVYPSKVWEYPWAITREALPEGELVLDAGCGVSTLPIYLATKGATVVALDSHPDWLAMEARAARFHGAPVVPVQMDMRELRFPDGTFDRVYCISVLEHVPAEDQPRTVREMARVLRPGGRLYLTVDYDERERRSRDDVVYDRLALQRNAIEPSGLVVEGTTDYGHDDWATHHDRMRHFKLHTFAAMSVLLRKPTAAEADAIEARRPKSFFRGVTLEDPARVAAASERGFDVAAVVLEGSDDAKRWDLGDLRGWAVVDSPFALGEAWVTLELRAPKGDWLDAHARYRAAADASHEASPARTVVASATTADVRRGRLDGAHLDAYRCAPEGPADELSRVRPCVATITAAPESVAGAFEAAREAGYAGAILDAASSARLDEITLR